MTNWFRWLIKARALYYSCLDSPWIIQYAHTARHEGLKANTLFLWTLLNQTRCAARYIFIKSFTLQIGSPARLMFAPWSRTLSAPCPITGVRRSNLEFPADFSLGASHLYGPHPATPLTPRVDRHGPRVERNYRSNFRFTGLENNMYLNKTTISYHKDAINGDRLGVLVYSSL